MKKKKNIDAIIALLLSCVTFSMMSCERRELDEDYVDTVLLPVSIDWSASGVPVGDMHRASIWFFPKQGGQPLEYRMEGDLSYREVQVPVGVYSVLVFNETADKEDWESITFTGTNRYETFAATGVSERVRGFYSRSESLPLIKNAEPLAAWSLDYLEVTPDMVIRSRAAVRNHSTLRRQSLSNEIPDLTAVKPLPRYERIRITAYVQNLSSAMQATGTIDSMAVGVYMASGEKISTSATQAFLLNSRVYDAHNNNNGTITSTLNVFGLLPEATHRLSIDFVLTDGTLFPQENFTLHNLSSATATEGTVKTHIVSVGYNESEEDHAIVLPDINLNAGITVDSWEEIVIPIR